MDGKRPIAAGLFAMFFALTLLGPLHAQPPSATTPPAEKAEPSSAQRRAELLAAMEERRARARAELRQRVERMRNPTVEDLRQRAAEYERGAPEREARRLEQAKRALIDGPELEMRAALSEQARKLLAARDFVQLDRLYDEYAQQSTRTPSGLWKSSLIYAGLRGPTGEAGSEQQYQSSDALLQQWLRERPNSALARLLRGHLMTRRAWAFRGGGYAVDVKEANWRPFYDWLRQANEYLDAEKAIVSARPEYYELMIDLLKARQKSPFPIFDQGVEKFPAYYEMYFSMLQYLLPKWNGGPEQIEHFASEAVARTQQIEGRGMYARIYWYASQTQYGDKLFVDTRANWERMRAGFEDVIARYPDQ